MRGPAATGRLFDQVMLFFLQLPPAPWDALCSFPLPLPKPALTDADAAAPPAPPPPDPCAQVLKLNLYSCFNILKPAVKTMMTTGGGSIVFCSSAVVSDWPSYGKMHVV